MSDDEIKALFRKTIEACPISLLTTIAPDGSPIPRPMATARVDEDYTVWYVTAASSRKCAHIAADQRVTVFWMRLDPEYTQNAYGFLQGTAEVVRDQETKSAFWKDYYARYFPAGSQDPEYVLLRIRPCRLEVSGADVVGGTVDFP